MKDMKNGSDPSRTSPFLLLIQDYMMSTVKRINKKLPTLFQHSFKDSIDRIWKEKIVKKLNVLSSLEKCQRFKFDP